MSPNALSVDRVASIANRAAETGTSPEIDLLVEATWAIAARTGSIEPSVREILQHAGVSTKAFYRHFRSKDELLLVALDRGTQVLVEYINRRMEPVPDPLDRIEVWIRGCMRQAVNPLAARRSLPWSLGFGRIASVFPDEIDRYQTALIAPLHREVERAAPSAPGRNQDPAGDAWLIFGYTMYTLRAHLVARTQPDAGTISGLVDFARRALRP